MIIFENRGELDPRSIVTFGGEFDALVTMGERVLKEPL